MSKGELKIKYLKRPYVLICSTYQIGILLNFNLSEKNTFRQLAIATQLNESDLINSLYALVRLKVLSMRPKPKSIRDIKITNNCAFKINSKFKNKRIKVNVNLPSKQQRQKENEVTNSEILEGRKLSIQACIVRIMKARKLISHGKLILETLSLMSVTFKPKVQTIKKCIDVLIEKEYIERVEGTKDMYSYIA